MVDLGETEKFLVRRGKAGTAGVTQFANIFEIVCIQDVLFIQSNGVLRVVGVSREL